MIKELIKELDDSKRGLTTYDKNLVNEMTIAFLMGALGRMEEKGNLSEEALTYIHAALQYGITQASKV